MDGVLVRLSVAVGQRRVGVAFQLKDPKPILESLQMEGNVLDILVFLKMLRTTGLAVRNTPLTNIPKGFSSEMTLEVA